MSAAVAVATARPASPGRGRWITLSEACRILGRSPGAIKSMALAGALASQAIPGARIVYSAADCLRLAELHDQAEADAHEMRELATA